MSKIKEKVKHIKSKHKEGYIEDIEEWQEHQYDPGYYTGGNIPPMIKNPGNSLLLGCAFLISAIFYGAIVSMLIIKAFDKDKLLEMIVAILAIYSIFALQIVVGIKLVRRGKASKIVIKKSTIKYLLITACIIILTICFGVSWYNSHTSEGDILIKSKDQLALKQTYDQNLVYIKEIDKTLNCSVEDYIVLWSMNINNDRDREQSAYKIIYRWNALNPHKGEIVEVKEMQ